MKTTYFDSSFEGDYEELLPLFARNCHQYLLHRKDIQPVPKDPLLLFLHDLQSCISTRCFLQHHRQLARDARLDP